MAVNDPTTNYGWNLPNVAGDSGNWGTLLNAIIGDDSTGLDAIVKAISVVANAALPKAGGTMTGRIDVKNEAFTAINLGTVSGATNCDLSLGNMFYGTQTGSIGLTFSNIPTGAVFVTVELTFSGGPWNVTFPSGTTFGQDSLKSTLANTVQTYCLYTRNGGTDWRAAHLANMTP
jgi:hypothetical protein